MDSFFYEDNLVLRTETKEDRKARGYMKFLWKRRDRSMCQSLIISGMFWMNEVSYNVVSGRKVDGIMKQKKKEKKKRKMNPNSVK